MVSPAATIVYVAGYGRSGSTLLDTMLGNHPDLFGGGELTWLFRFAQDASQWCSCGVPLKECTVWAELFDSLRRGFPDLTLADAAALNLRCERLGGRASEADRARYRELWSFVLSTLRAAAGTKAIVDSSKISRLSYHRLELLASLHGEETRTIHLTRDPRSVMQSVARGSNRRTEAGIDSRIRGGMYRGLVGWFVSNRLTEHLRSSLPGGSAHGLRYEDLTQDPEAALRKLETFLGHDLSTIRTICRARGAFSPEHGLSGNRMRRAGRIVLRSERDHPLELSLSGRMAVALVRPMMRRYGYE